MAFPQFGGNIVSYEVTPAFGVVTQIVNFRGNRTALIIQNTGTVDVYIGGDSTVNKTTAAGPPATNRGYLLKGGQTPPSELRDLQGAINGVVYAYVDSASTNGDLQITEVVPSGSGY